MATKRATQLSNDLVKIAAEIKFLNGEIDRLKKNNTTAAEIEAKFGAKLKETLAAYTNVVNAVVKYNKANKGNAKSNEELQKSLASLSSRLNETRTAHNSLISTKNKQTEADKRLVETQRKLEASQKENARLTEKLAKASAKAKEDEAKAFAKAEEKKAREAQKTSEKLQRIAEKRGDFFGGISESFTPNAIGRAIGSVTKFVSIYNILGSAVSAVNDLIFGSVKSFVDFEARLARVRAVAGATAEETNKLEKSIRGVAGTTVFTLGEVASLTEELVKLGFSSDQAAASILPVAQTAQALGESANDVALLLGTVSKEFGLTTAEMASAGDVLVGAINNSALSFDSFRTAIQYVGPLARQNGVTLSETAAAMGLLANAGFSASRIGTGLRQVFIKLGESGENVIDQLEELSKKGVSLGEALEITDVRTAAAVSTLALAAPLIRELAKDFESVGRASLASAIQTNTFSGQVKLLNSAYDDFKVTLGSIISESKILVTIIGALSRSAERAAISASLISDQRFNVSKFSKSVDEVSKSFNNQENAVKLARKAAQDLVAELTGEAWFNSRKEVDALAESILKSAKTQDDFRKSITLTQVFYDKYDQSVRSNKTTIESLTLKLAELNNELQNGTILTIDQRIEKEAEKKAIESLIQTLGRERDARAKADEERKKQREKRSKEEVEEIKRRAAQLREDVKRIKQANSEEVKVIEERTKLILKDKTLSAAQIAKIQSDSDAEIQSSNERAVQGVIDSLVLLEGVYIDAGKVVKKYGKEFPDVVKGLEDSVADLSIVFNETSRSFEATFSQKANKAIEQQTEILAGYKNQVDGIDKAFGSKAGKTKAYFKEVRKATEQTIDSLETLILSIDDSSEEGKAAIKVISNEIEVLRDRLTRSSIWTKEEWAEYWKKTLVESLTEALSVAADAYKMFNDVVFENTKNRLEAEKNAIKNRSDVENDILKSQLQNQLITEEEFRNRSENNRKRAVARENQIDEKIFEAEKKRDKNRALTDFLQASAQSLINEILSGKPFPANAISSAITIGLAGSAYASQLSAINKREFFPKRFAEGGMVDGPSHAEGGVPFTVQGRGGYEMEGGEFIVNKRAAAVHRSLLERINSSAKPTPSSGSYAYDNVTRIPTKFAEGGSVSAARIDQTSKEQLAYLRAIAEATNSTALGVSKPVRAFVTQTDLRNDELGRRIANKNNTL